MTLGIGNRCPVENHKAVPMRVLPSCTRLREPCEDEEISCCEDDGGRKGDFLLSRLPLLHLHFSCLSFCSAFLGSKVQHCWFPSKGRDGREVLAFPSCRTKSRAFSYTLKKACSRANSLGSCIPWAVLGWESPVQIRAVGQAEPSPWPYPVELWSRE